MKQECGNAAFTVFAEQRTLRFRTPENMSLTALYISIKGVIK